MEHFFTPYDNFPLHKNDAKIIAKHFSLDNFQHYKASFDNLKNTFENKDNLNFDFLEIIRKQYIEFDAEDDYEQILIKNNYKKGNKVYTITCAHQPILFGGPMYVLLKIIDCIVLCEKLRKQNPNICFLPIFYIGAEDHDVDEICKVSIFNKTIQWHNESKAASGFWKIDENFIQTKNELFSIIKNTPNEAFICDIIEQCFVDKNYGISYQKFIHKIFGKYGLLSIQPNDKQIKAQMKFVFSDELKTTESFKKVTETNEILKEHLDIQAKPREINLFFSDEHARNRIILDGEQYKVMNTNICFNKNEIQTFVDNNYANISPNVILRPLMQEYILPNILFIGGGAEISYWLQLKTLFKYYNIQFPMLLRRSSAIIVEKNSIEKLKKWDIDLKYFIQNINDIEKKYLQEHKSKSSNIDFEFQTIQEQLNNIKNKAKDIDFAMLSSIEADEVKIIKILQNVVSKLDKTEKNKMEIVLKQLENIREKIMPNKVLHERKNSWIEYFAMYGFDWLEYMIQHQDAFKGEMLIIKP